MFSGLLLVVSCLGHSPHLPFYFSGYYSYNMPSGYVYIPPSPPPRVIRPKITDPVLADMGYRNRLLTLLAQDSHNSELKKAYLAAKKQIERERLQYLMRSSYAPSAYTPSNYQSPGCSSCR